MFVTLEGIDGSGKSTQADRLEEWLVRELGAARVLRTREPGGWPGGEALRAFLLRERGRHPWSEVLLFLADRCEHAARVLLPALEEGRVVLCERYQDSTLAYQVYGRGLPREPIDRIFRAAGLPLPDLTLLYDLSPEEARRRVRSRGEADRFEAEEESFLARVREGYLEMVRQDPERILRLDAASAPEDLFLRAAAAIRPLLR